MNANTTSAIFKEIYTHPHKLRLRPPWFSFSLFSRALLAHISTLISIALSSLSMTAEKILWIYRSACVCVSLCVCIRSSLCVYVCVSAHISVCVSLFVFISVYMCAYASLHMLLSVCLYVHLYACLCSVCVCMSLSVCLQAYLCTCLCLSVSIYAHMPILEHPSLRTYHLLRFSLSSAVFYSFQRFRSTAMFVRYSLKMSFSDDIENTVLKSSNSVSLC